MVPGEARRVVRSPGAGVKVGVLGTEPGPSAGAEILLMPSRLQRTRFALRTYYHRLLHFRFRGFFICYRVEEPSWAIFIRWDWDLGCSSGFLMTVLSDLVECFSEPTDDKLANKFLGLKKANQRHS